VRYKFKFRSAISLLIFLPLATPEIIMGSGLAAQFFNLGVDRGLGTVIAAHVLFCFSYVVVTVKGRVQILDPVLEEAGRDLYASPAKVFWKITFPLLLPGIIAAALLSFALSFDDFIITYFNSGPVQTFPLFIYSQTKGVPAEANVISSAVFLLAIAIVVGTQINSILKKRKLKTLS
jgi:spermidine/putrescine transport system permease protein